jgi:thioredoxin-related protein
MRVICFAAFFLIPYYVFPQVNWISFSQALENNAQNPRKILIDVYTDWCGWCKRMDAATFSDPGIASYINANFWPVKFNAESRDTIVYAGKIYAPVPAGGRHAHPLAAELLGGRLSYPSIIYLNDKSELIAPIPGYRDASDIQPFLVYFAEEIYKNADLQKFIDDYKTASGAQQNNSIKWQDASSAFVQAEQTGKNILFYFTSSQSAASKLMLKAPLADTLISGYINSSTVPVLFDIGSSIEVRLDSLVFRKNPQAQYNEFAVSLLNSEMKAPAIVMLTPKRELICRVPGYFTAEILEPLLMFFNESSYMQQTWEQFRASYLPWER